MSDKSIQDQIGMADSFEEALRLITENPPKPDAKYNRQPVNMSLIKVDPERLQSRVETSEEVVQQYMMEAQSGDQFPPMVVFFDTEKQCVWLADGFHRHEMYRRLGYRWADCDVKFGTLECAIEFAATANSKHGLRITTSDRKKSAEMLFVLPIWWERSSSDIAKKVGVTPATISCWREEFAIKNKIRSPEVVFTSKGTPINKKRKSRKILTENDALSKIAVKNRGDGLQFYTINHNSKREYLGSDLDIAKRKAVELFRSGWFDGLRGKPNQTSLRTTTGFFNWARKNHVPVSRPGTRGGFSSPISDTISLSLLCDVLVSGAPVRISDDVRQENFSGLVGDLVMAMCHSESNRAFLVCYLPVQCKAMAILAEKAGILTMSPEEFVSRNASPDLSVSA